MKRYLSVILCLLTVLVLCPSFTAKAVSTPVSIVKVGLSYGDNGVPAAKLQNVSGYDKGYKIGFFNNKDSSVFYTLITTDYSEIAVIKDKPIWITSSNDYYDVKPTSHKYYIGSYHIQLDQTFNSAADAMEYAPLFTQMGYQAFPAYINGTFRLRVSEFLTKSDAEAAMVSIASSTGLGFTVVGNSETCYTVTVTGTDKILFELDSFGQPLGIQPNSTVTWYNKYKYYGDFEYRRVYGNDLTVINVIEMNDYIKGVIPYEISTSWPVEAQKAQAICAKSYACNNIGKHRSMGFDLCNTTDCQVYYGTGQANAVSDSVVDSVNGIYATYAGQIAMTYYHSNSGGHTEDVENIWGSYVPYLRGVEDIYLENTAPYSITVDLNTISEILQQKNYTNQKITYYYISRTSAAGNVLEVSFTLQDGSTLKLSGDRSRTALNSTPYNIRIPSHRFTITPTIGLYINRTLLQTGTSGLHAIGDNGTIVPLNQKYSTIKAITSSGIVSLEPNSVSFTINGNGSGHHIGMSQRGAYYMANKGFGYEDILKFYFTGIQLTYLG